MSPEARGLATREPPRSHWRDAGIGALVALPVAAVLSQINPAAYRSGAAAIAFVVVVGLAMRWTVALGAAPLVWLATVIQVTDDFADVPSARDIAGLIVIAISLGVVILALRRWEGDRRRAREEATARRRNERRLQALVELAHHLARIGSRAELYAAVERPVPTAAGSAGAILIVREGDRVEFPAVAGHDPGSFPPHLTEIRDRTPEADVLRSGRAVFCPTREQLVARYPDLGPFVERSGQQAWCALPVPDVGVLVLTWPDAQVFSPAQRAFLETIANLFAAAAERIRAVEQAQRERFVAAFDAMLDGVGIHRAVRDASGRVVDLEIEYLNPASVHEPQRVRELVGRRMSEVWPDSPTLPEYLKVVETGAPFVLDDADVSTLGGPYSHVEAVSIRASRLDPDRIVLTVRDVSERVGLLREVRDTNEMFAVAQQLARVGSWRYDFRTDRLDWSPELYRIVGVPEGTEPVRPVDGSLFGFEHPDDRGMVARVIRDAMEAREPFTFDMRLIRQDDGEIRDVTTTGIFRTDRGGNLAGVWGATQDVTERRRAERSRRAALAALADQREAVEALQQVILPAVLPDIAGAALSARYRAATLSDAVGGDWYDAFVAPDGRVVLVVGDVAGHGVQCAALANQLRVAVRIRVRDGLEPGEILSLLDAELDDGFVTCWLATYEPVTRTLRAANAGHLPAVLSRCGAASRVTGYTVPPLGTRAVPEVTEDVVHLEPGDLLILYTDGLVERRGEDLDHGIARLERVARVISDAGDPALALVDELAPDAADDVCVVTLRVD